IKKESSGNQHPLAGGQAKTKDVRARAPPTIVLRNDSRRADAGRRHAPETGTSDQTVSGSLELLTGRSLKWFRNQELIFRLKT
ncbi:MAG: hypothetical protein JRE65_01890, partial [Deltaproteobacteria bacterium]|nr:hypothetical protein [Deltaproteobacteria bacterium]